MPPTKTTRPKAAKKKQATDVLLGLIIDKSGSMGEMRGGQDLRGATIEGVNQLLAEQRAHPDGRCFVSMTLFDTTFNPRYVAVDVTEVENFTEVTYQPGGGTALYDAVGVTIDGLDGWLRNHPEFTGKVAVAIWTDGEENSSIRYPRYGGLDHLMEVVKARQDAGWEFMFLGTGGSAWTEGERVGGFIGAMNTVPVAATGQAVRTSYAAASANTSSLRSTGSTQTIAASYDELANSYDEATKTLAETKDDEESPTP